MHAFFCLCSFVLVYFAYPETMGIPLEGMDRLFGDTPHSHHEAQPLRRSSMEILPPKLLKRSELAGVNYQSVNNEEEWELLGLDNEEVGHH